MQKVSSLKIRWTISKASSPTAREIRGICKSPQSNSHNQQLPDFIDPEDIDIELASSEARQLETLEVGSAAKPGCRF